MSVPEVTDACAQCGGSRKEAVRDHARSDSGTRLAREVWELALERDPFCSMECCRAWHGLTLPERDLGNGDCIECGKQLPSRNSNAGLRCWPCSQAEKRKRNFDVPGLCAGCGVPVAEYSDACWTCGDRRRSRARREDPAYRARVAERDRARWAARKAAKSATCPPGSQASPRGAPALPGGTTTFATAIDGEADAPAVEGRKAA